MDINQGYTTMHGQPIIKIYAYALEKLILDFFESKYLFYPYKRLGKGGPIPYQTAIVQKAGWCNAGQTTAC